MSTAKPLAAMTVELPCVMNGQEIIDLVLKVVQENGEEPVALSRFDDGDVTEVGQRSSYPHNHLKVIPSGEDDDAFRPEEPYSAIRVVSHRWPIGSVYAIGYDPSMVVDAVKDFAAKMINKLHAD